MEVRASTYPAMYEQILACACNFYALAMDSLDCVSLTRRSVPRGQPRLMCARHRRRLCRITASYARRACRPR
eukprot:5838836-Pleurochrysis_carterae.AAC.1